MLYLVATPIGNLADLSFRAVSVLKECDYILCEDTRHSYHLLKHYQIDRPLKSFHKFNESKQQEEIIADLRDGKNIGLISDAGTPLIADPGESLILRLQEENLPITSIPGASAVLTALTLSGFPPIPFQFIGFLSKKEQELCTQLQQALLYPGTTITYETPHRIVKTLEAMEKLDPKRKLCIARELTKLHEECLSGNAAELLSHFQKNTPRGEMVFMISPPSETASFEHLTIKEHVAHLQDALGLSKPDAIKLAAEQRHVPKRIVYNALLD